MRGARGSAFIPCISLCGAIVGKRACLIEKNGYFRARFFQNRDKIPLFPTLSPCRDIYWSFVKSGKNDGMGLFQVPT